MGRRFVQAVFPQKVTVDVSPGPYASDMNPKARRVPTVVGLTGLTALTSAAVLGPRCKDNECRKAASQEVTTAFDRLVRSVEADNARPVVWFQPMAAGTAVLPASPFRLDVNRLDGLALLGD
jgi:hypothetical protein